MRHMVVIFGLNCDRWTWVIGPGMLHASRKAVTFPGPSGKGVRKEIHHLEKL